jgi:hypothetical protein
MPRRSTTWRARAQSRCRRPTAVVVCGSAYGKTVCTCSAHIKANAIETWLLERLAHEVFVDGECVEAAVERFVEKASGEQQTNAQFDAWRREVEQIDTTVKAITMNIDPANLPLLNDRLTQLRHRKDHVEREIMRAERSLDGLDEKALRKWANERVGGLAAAMKGQRDEKVRQVIASYIEEIIIYPSTKTGHVTFKTTATKPQNERDRPLEGRSRAYEVVWSKPYSSTRKPKS